MARTERTTYDLRMQRTRTKHATTKPRRAHTVRVDLMAELQRSEITERIKLARREAGLTQAEMADAIDVAARTYQNYEDFRVPWGLLNRISMVTGRSVAWLLHGEEAPISDTPALMGRLSELEAKLDELITLHRLPPDPDAVDDLAAALGGDDDLDERPPGTQGEDDEPPGEEAQAS